MDNLYSKLQSGKEFIPKQKLTKQTVDKFLTNKQKLLKARTAFNKRRYLDAWKYYTDVYSKLEKNLEILADNEDQGFTFGLLEIKDEKDLNNIKGLIFIIDYIKNRAHIKQFVFLNFRTVSPSDRVQQHLYYRNSSTAEQDSDFYYVKGLRKEYTEEKKEYIVIDYIDSLIKLDKINEVYKKTIVNKNRIQWKRKELGEYIREQWEASNDAQKKYIDHYYEKLHSTELTSALKIKASKEFNNLLASIGIDLKSYEKKVTKIPNKNQKAKPYSKEKPKEKIETDKTAPPPKKVQNQPTIQDKAKAFMDMIGNIEKNNKILPARSYFERHFPWMNIQPSEKDRKFKPVRFINDLFNLLSAHLKI